MQSRQLRLGSLVGTLLCAMLMLGAQLVTAAPPTTAADGVLNIPLSTIKTSIDGSCSEYADVTPQTYTDAAGDAKVYLIHDGTYLYVCVVASPGSNKERFESLYLDPNGDGTSYTFAAKDDYALHVALSDSANSTYNGSTIANGYVVNTSRAGVWDGVSTANANGDTIEYRVSFGRFGIDPCKVFGIAAYHHWVASTGDDYGWPSNTYFDQPGTWKPARIDSGQCGGRQSGRIAYIYRGNTADATSFYNLLVGAGYSVDLIPLTSVLSTTFRTVAGGPNYDLIIVADDSGSLNAWGSTAPPPDISADQVTRLRSAGLPIIGLGEGGYAFFGKLPLFIGWPQGWHGPADRTKKSASAPAAYFTGVAADPVTLYTAPVNSVGIYLNPTPLPSDVITIGEETPATNHANLIQQGCRMLWGFSGNPNVMTGDGKAIFLNAVGYMRTFQCAPEPPDPTGCTITKSADPAGGTAVRPGQTIRYTLTYVNCKPEQARLIDTVPTGTIFVPGSASDAATPAPDGVLAWSIAASASGSKSFKVLVGDTLCRDSSKVFNRATLLVGGAAVDSNSVIHPLDCPPIVMPNDEPPYAEREVEITPYPLVTGTPSTIKVRLINTSATPQQVNVAFNTSPQRFGIGINFTAFDTRTVTIPAGGSIIVSSLFTPVSSGHYCIMIEITDASPTPQYQPVRTYRNLDVTEDLKPGMPDNLVFKVANPTSATANINLVVINTCPGWLATVSPATLTAVGPNGADVRDATLTVTPPNPATLGSGCHIDVQGWIGDTLIGGIRKLDVPPVHLPPDVDPPWLEPEISMIPNPPTAGQPAQICVDLQNPLTMAKNVLLEYAVADFGAGIGFTQVATRSVALPPLSNGTYCVPWTPASGGTLHRCIQVILRQAGYLPLRSQRNVNLQQVTISSLPRLRIPIRVGNPDLVRHKLEFVPHFWGVDPNVRLVFPEGDPPAFLEPGQTVGILIGLNLPTVQAGTQASSPLFFGDEHRVDVTVKLDGEEISGFTIMLAPPQPIYLPFVSRI